MNPNLLSKLQILEILEDWNYWNRDFDTFHNRAYYLKKIKLFRESGEIIVLTGIRRSGKSTLLKMEMQDLAKKIDKTQLLYINFEDARFQGNINTDTLDLILETYRENINPDKEIYIFLDEIQHVKGWPQWVYTIYELKKAHIYVTGSSSKLLSEDIATAISGRYLKVDVFPLTFGEFMRFKGIDINDQRTLIKDKIKINRFFSEYLNHGGFPKITTYTDKDLKNEEILSYFNTILLKDIMARYNLRNYDKLKRFAYYMISNDTHKNNIRSISKALGYTYETVEDYIGYLKETYMLFEIKNYDYSLKKQLKSDIKYYTIDTGFINAISFKFTEDIGKLYENVVFNHFLKNSKEIFFFSEKDSECDFILKEKKDITAAFQVCYNLDENNMERELKGLIMACKRFKLKEGYIITDNIYNNKKKDNINIKIRPITHFLLKKEYR